jgi:hypothetical protein
MSSVEIDGVAAAGQPKMLGLSVNGPPRRLHHDVAIDDARTGRRLCQSVLRQPGWGHRPSAGPDAERPRRHREWRQLRGLFPPAAPVRQAGGQPDGRPSPIPRDRGADAQCSGQPGGPGQPGWGCVRSRRGGGDTGVVPPDAGRPRGRAGGCGLGPGPGTVVVPHRRHDAFARERGQCYVSPGDAS